MLLSVCQAERWSTLIVWVWCLVLALRMFAEWLLSVDTVSIEASRTVHEALRPGVQAADGRGQQLCREVRVMDEPEGLVREVRVAFQQQPEGRAAGTRKLPEGERQLSHRRPWGPPRLGEQVVHVVQEAAR
eukprot:1114172-Lingulodinium_polyedra.AAC.1